MEIFLASFISTLVGATVGSRLLEKNNKTPDSKPKHLQEVDDWNRMFPEGEAEQRRERLEAAILDYQDQRVDAPSRRIRGDK